MTARSPAAVVVASALAGALFAGTVRLQAARERLYPAPEETEASLYLRSGVALRRFTGAYTTLAADLYWIRTIQYYGGTKKRLDRRGAAGLAAPPAHMDAYPLLSPLLDITTTLDPRFNIAYRFGAIYLAEPYPRGADRPDFAIALLQKGLREVPDKWQYKQDIGFIHYWFTHDFTVAAEWFKKAADTPGSPWWLRSLAATTLVRGGDRQSSRAMWQAIRESAEIDWLKQDAERRLLQLQALDTIDALQRAADTYAQRTGEVPTFDALTRARVLLGYPLDPVGTPFEMKDGRVRLSPASSLWPPPDEPDADRRPPA